jgi:hypothetical protein
MAAMNLSPVAAGRRVFVETRHALFTAAPLATREAAR